MPGARTPCLRREEGIQQEIVSQKSESFGLEQINLEF